MSARLLVSVTLAAIAVSPLVAQAPIEMVRRAVQAAGGESALRSLASTVAEFNVATFGLGQEETPLSPARGPLTFGRLVTDHANQRRLLEQEIRPITGGVTRQRRVTAGGLGMTVTNGAQAADPPAATGQVLQTMRLQPERLLLRALEATLTALTPRSWRGELKDGVRFAVEADTVSLYFDRTSALPTVALTVTDDPILGDRRTVIWFTRWQNAGGVLLPRQVDVEVNGRLQSQTYFTSIAANAPLADSMFAIPDSIASRARALPSAAAVVTVQLVELASGVWRAEGGSHHSLVVDQGATLLVVEAPQTARRFQAVLDTLRSRFPAKPVSAVVSTHHHWDHTGGVRAALAAGLPMVAHRRNLGFLQSIGSARKTVAADALSRGRPVPSIRPVDDSLSLGRGPGRVVVYRIPTVHAEGLLGVYVPGARILFTSDVVNPGPGPLPALGSAELVGAARSLGISVDRYAGGHGVVVTWADLERAAGRP